MFHIKKTKVKFNLTKQELFLIGCFLLLLFVLFLSFEIRNSLKHKNNNISKKELDSLLIENKENLDINNINYQADYNFIFVNKNKELIQYEPELKKNIKISNSINNILDIYSIKKTGTDILLDSRGFYSPLNGINKLQIFSSEENIFDHSVQIKDKLVTDEKILILFSSRYSDYQGPQLADKILKILIYDRIKNNYKVVDIENLDINNYLYIGDAKLSKDTSKIYYFVNEQREDERKVIPQFISYQSQKIYQYDIKKDKKEKIIHLPNDKENLLTQDRNYFLIDSFNKDKLLLKEVDPYDEMGIVGINIDRFKYTIDLIGKSILKKETITICKVKKNSKYQIKEYNVFHTDNKNLFYYIGSKKDNSVKTDYLIEYDILKNTEKIIYKIPKNYSINNFFSDKKGEKIIFTITENSYDLQKKDDNKFKNYLYESKNKKLILLLEEKFESCNISPNGRFVVFHSELNKNGYGEYKEIYKIYDLNSKEQIASFENEIEFFITWLKVK